MGRADGDERSMTGQEVTWGQAGQKAGEAKEGDRGGEGRSRVQSCLPYQCVSPFLFLPYLWHDSVTSLPAELGWVCRWLSQPGSLRMAPRGGCFLWSSLAVTV